MARSQLSQFDEMRINNGGTLTDREQGYQAYYAEELEFLQSDDSMDWLKKCMGVVLKHTDIEQYHILDEKQVRLQWPASWMRVLNCPSPVVVTVTLRPTTARLQRRKLRKNRIIESLTEQAKGGTKHEAKMSAVRCPTYTMAAGLIPVGARRVATCPDHHFCAVPDS